MTAQFDAINRSEEAEDGTDGGSARPAEAREPKPGAQRQGEAQQQQHPESAGHPSLIKPTHGGLPNFGYPPPLPFSHPSPLPPPVAALNLDASVEVFLVLAQYCIRA